MESPTIRYSEGRLILYNASDYIVANIAGIKWDTRILQWTVAANAYRQLINFCSTNHINLIDEARKYNKLEIKFKNKIIPRIHQQKALNAWIKAQGMGVISLPTGAGKTYLGILAINKIQRPTLVVVPTIDLMNQWIQVIKETIDIEKIGALGGGEHNIQDICIATYDSALIYLNKIGNKFGLIIFDECHHLPATQYQSIGMGMIAPFRLGLSATVERTDEKEYIIYELIGPLVYKGYIHNMISTDILSPYDVISIYVSLLPHEQQEYQYYRNIYLNFLRKYQINFNRQKFEWNKFIFLASRTQEGKNALRAYQIQKKIAQASSAKLIELWNILFKHKNEQKLIFTDDNDLAYKIAKKFILPAITHLTKLRERQQILEAFKNGQIKTIVTSKVLNEGIDVPAANVAVVVSGSGAVREHVQRLGRILRHRPGKRAVLYELVSNNTLEYFVNKRRKQHHAYQKNAHI